MKTHFEDNNRQARYTFRRLMFTAMFGATLLTAASQSQPFGRPLVFEPNVGQAASQVKWLARGNGYQLFLTADGATMVMRDHSAEAPKTAFLPASFSPTRPLAAPVNESRSSVMRMKLNGSRSWENVKGLEPTGGVSNYFLGNDPKQWHLRVPHYARIQTAGVYDGIDLVLYSHGGELEYDFVVAPYADPKQIRLAFDGVEAMRVDGTTGDLLLTADGSQVRQLRPRVYQQFGNRQVDVAGAYEILDRKEATFELAAYDTGSPLVIDPTVSFTTFLAGSNQDYVQAAAVDGSANAYVIGTTLSTDFPTVAPLQTYKGNPAGCHYGACNDAFVTKLSSTGTILFSTYLGGSGDDWGMGIAVDSTGVYVTGSTWSSNFPTHESISTPNGQGKVFVAKLSTDGTQLLYSTYLGGAGDDRGNAIAIDSTGAAYVTGETTSPNFPRPSVETPLQASKRGIVNAFIAKLAPMGTSLLYSTYWGGTADANGEAIALDGSGHVYVTGQVVEVSTGFPLTSGGRACVVSGSAGDVFALKFIPGTAAPVYSTCFSALNSGGAGIAADSSGNAYITGITGSPNFPTTAGALQTVKVSQGWAGFLTKLNSTGGFAYSTYLGGNDGWSRGFGIALDRYGEVYVVGATSSTTFPLAPPIVPNPSAGFVAKFTPQMNALDYVTFLGAQINGVAIYQAYSRFGIVPTYPKVYVGGSRYTGSITNSAEDAFVSMLDETPGTTICCAAIP
jgi:hypothetical protein